MTDVIKKIRGINEVLPDLLLGIFSWIFLCGVVGVILVSNKGSYLVSLLIGGVVAVAMGIHMAWSLEKALRVPGATVKIMQQQSMLRYGVIVVVFLVVLVTPVLNPLVSFLGVVGLKVAAYLQPFTHKVIQKLFGE